jgi:hypothetical protein
MNLETKKDLASNWFKTLQDAFCDDICRIEKKNIEFYKVEKFLIKLELIFLRFTEIFQNNFKKIYLVLKKIRDFGRLEFL